MQERRDLAPDAARAPDRRRGSGTRRAAGGSRRPQRTPALIPRREALRRDAGAQRGRGHRRHAQHPHGAAYRARGPGLRDRRDRRLVDRRDGWEIATAAAAEDERVRVIRAPDQRLRPRRPRRPGGVQGRRRGDRDGRRLRRPADLVRYYRAARGGLRLRVRLALHARRARSGLPALKLAVNRVVNLGIRVLFGHGYNDTTNAFKAYRRR